MKDRKGFYIAFIVVSIAVLGLSVAYAALSTTLNIKFGSVTQNALSWDVGFVAGTVNAVVSGTSATGRSCGSATVTKSSVTVSNITLSKPGDKCTYTLPVKNSGDIAAKRSSITNTVPSSECSSSGYMMNCGNIKYMLSSDSAGTTALGTNSGSLAAGSTENIYLVVSYIGDSLNSSAVSQTGAGFTIVYTQA